MNLKTLCYQPFCARPEPIDIGLSRERVGLWGCYLLRNSLVRLVTSQRSMHQSLSLGGRCERAQPQGVSNDVQRPKSIVVADENIEKLH